MMNNEVKQQNQRFNEDMIQTDIKNMEMKSNLELKNINDYQNKFKVKDKIMNQRQN